MTTTNERIPSEKWKTKVLIIGIVLGALTGLGTAYLLIQRADQEEGIKLTPGEGAKLGVTLFSFLRQVSQL
ncbi:MAG: hypothetical protein FJ010_02305 [Chloroflexi bacterium]|nr:hypothetical protein [Chloroflexota bacterium]